MDVAEGTDFTDRLFLADLEVEGSFEHDHHVDGVEAVELEVLVKVGLGGHVGKIELELLGQGGVDQLDNLLIGHVLLLTTNDELTPPRAKLFFMTASTSIAAGSRR